MNAKVTTTLGTKYDIHRRSGGGKEPIVIRTPPIIAAHDVRHRPSVILHRQVKRTTAGFTLLETLFCILLLMVMAISITGACMSARTALHIEQTQPPLEEQIRKRMEEILSRSYEAVVDGSQVVTIRGQKHTISWTVTHPDLDNDSTPDSIAKQITITSGEIRLTALLIDSNRLAGKI